MSTGKIHPTAIQVQVTLVIQERFSVFFKIR